MDSLCEQGRPTAEGTANVLREVCRGLWHVFSMDEVRAEFLAPGVGESIGRAISKFPESKEVRFCKDSLERREQPEEAKSKEQASCILRHAPHCSEGCPAQKGFLCMKCCIPMRLFRCVTCDGKTSEYRRLCESCFDQHHRTIGHIGISLFRPGTCDSLVVISKRS